MPSYEDLQLAMRNLNDATPVIQTAEACGYDCQQYKQRQAELSQQLTRIMQALYPNGQPRKRR